ncbi:hypothetical protein [Microbacterium sp. T32]|uniref:hypothetical protein n=1 Tax=Microbacterium sp. T32 TaxID=1776083 RepID=UPI0007ABF3D3|nr:hypothetical protein [Microbacterium sp. T32]KZE41440.1 hypothetical protein AVW09_02290 [Microbacterium sp. T32]
MRLALADPAAVARAEELLADGQLATWVGEEVGLGRSSIYAIAKQVPDRAEHVLAWQQVWAQIRRNPTLVALHREFNPA